LRTLWDPFQKIRFTELKDAVQAGEQLSMWIIEIETPIDNYGNATSERSKDSFSERGFRTITGEI